MSSSHFDPLTTLVVGPARAALKRFGRLGTYVLEFRFLANRRLNGWDMSHPAAEAVIPGHPVLVIPNPLQGWTVTRATVLSRLSRRTIIGWNTIAKASCHLNSADAGSAMYDESGRLLGFMVGVDPKSGESQFVIVDSAIAALVETARGSKS